MVSSCSCTTCAWWASSSRQLQGVGGGRRGREGGERGRGRGEEEGGERGVGGGGRKKGERGVMSKERVTAMSLTLSAVGTW